MVAERVKSVMKFKLEDAYAKDLVSKAKRIFQQIVEREQGSAHVKNDRDFIFSVFSLAAIIYLFSLDFVKDCGGTEFARKLLENDYEFFKKALAEEQDQTA